MKKFFIALTILLAVTVSNAEAATQFTDEQLKQMISITMQNPAAVPLNLDVATFQKNFDAFITDFFNRGDDPDRSNKLKKIFLIGEPKLATADEMTLFVKRFPNGAAIFGSVDENGKFKVLNYFTTFTEDKNERLVHVMVFEAFIRGISPDNDAINLLTEAKENPTVTKAGVKYSFVKDGKLNIVSAVAE